MFSSFLKEIPIHAIRLSQPNQSTFYNSMNIRRGGLYPFPEMQPSQATTSPQRVRVKIFLINIATNYNNYLKLQFVYKRMKKIIIFCNLIQTDLDNLHGYIGTPFAKATKLHMCMGATGRDNMGPSSTHSTYLPNQPTYQGKHGGTIHPLQMLHL